MDRNADLSRPSVDPPGQRQPHHLILGGAASGKSALAERMTTALARKRGARRIYVATAQVHDSEMAAKIRRHRLQRGEDWTTREVPLDVPQALNDLTAQDVLLLDCATLWITNLLLADREVAVEEARLVAALKDAKAPVFIVSNEVGQGIVPDNALSRQFREAQGRLNQALAVHVDHVVAVIAGLPLALKGPLPDGAL